MSLQVWLPLTKDLRQQGLSNAEVINNGATYSSTGGKLGGCYSFNRSTPTYLKVNNPIVAAENGVSITFWINLPSNASGNNQIVHIGNGPGWGNNRCTVFVRSGASYLIFSLSGGSDATSTQYTLVSSSLPLNTWTHVACVYSMGKAKIYLNGVLDHEYTISIIPSFNNTSYIGVGAAPNAGEGITCSLNDVRVYDHCLSPMEVKQISQGLVLHYLLEDKWCETTTNLASVSTGGWNNSGACVRLSNDTSLDSTKPTSGSVTSVKITTTGNCALTCGTTSASHPSKTLTFSIWCYLSGPQEGNTIYIRSTKTDGNVGNFEYNGSTDPRNWPLNKWIRLEKTITTASDATTFYFCTYANTLNRYIALNGWQIEEKSHANPWTPPGTTRAASVVEYDCSGFGNNGTRTGTFTWSSDTPKYAVSQDCIGTNYIYLTPPSAEVQTIAIWVNWKAIPSGQSVILVDNGSGIGLGLMNTGILCSTSGAGSSYTFDKTSLVANTWYHFVVVKTGTTTRKLYINGVEQTAKTTTSNWTYSVNQLQLGKRSTTSDGFIGKLSDFRCYATALSADDIRALYENSAYIDNSGNTYAATYTEV